MVSAAAGAAPAPTPAPAAALPLLGPAPTDTSLVAPVTNAIVNVIQQNMLGAPVPKHSMRISSYVPGKQYCGLHAGPCEDHHAVHSQEKDRLALTVKASEASRVLSQGERIFAARLNLFSYEGTPHSQQRKECDKKTELRMNVQPT